MSSHRSNRIRALIFDLDGTLIDSKQDIVNQVNRTLRDFGFPERSPSELARGIGSGSHTLFKALFAGHSSAHDDAFIDQVVQQFRKNYRAHMADSTEPFPGVWEMLQHFKELPKAIITNKAQLSADSICSHLGLTPHFVAIHGLEAFKTHKPDPGPIREACALLGVEPHEVAFVGDTPVDMAAAKGAGAISVAALYGYGEHAELMAIQPSHAIERVAQLMEIL